MNDGRAYVWAALAIAVATHFAIIHATPRLLMHMAVERVSASGFNAWRVADRITPDSREIVRPSPDFAYSICAFDLGAGPVTLRVGPWREYWSLSLYAANSDNFYVIDDREARSGAELVLVEEARDAPEDAVAVVSPSRRGIALIRRLAPTPDAHAAATRAATEDVCATAAQMVGQL